MDLGKAFSFVFEDDNWITTILVGGLLLLVPIIGQLWLLGFLIQTARNVVQGSARPMADMSDFGGKLGMGFWNFVIALVYAIPVVLISLLFACIIALGGGMAEASEGAAAGTLGLAFACLLPLLIVVSLILQPLIIVATARYVQTDNVGDALRFGEIWGALRKDLSDWIVLWLVQILCGFVGSLGGIVFGIGALFTYVYSQAVFGHAMGQIIRKVNGSTAMTYEADATPPPAYQ